MENEDIWVELWFEGLLAFYYPHGATKMVVGALKQFDHQFAIVYQEVPRPRMLGAIAHRPPVPVPLLIDPPPGTNLAVTFEKMGPVSFELPHKVVPFD